MEKKSGPSPSGLAGFGLSVALGPQETANIDLVADDDSGFGFEKHRGNPGLEGIPQLRH